MSETGTGKPKRPLAPRNVSVFSIENVDERAQIAKKYQLDGYKMVFGDRTKTRDYLDQGYEPVMDEGQAVHHKGDPLYRVNAAYYQDRKRRAELESVQILEQARMGGRTQDVIRDSTGEAHRVQVDSKIDD
jgi:hypothetical protein